MMRILLVDDDLPTRHLLASMLQKMGHEIVHANDGIEAWEILINNKISIVISDWQMPRMDGVELCRKLRAAELSHYIYVILITGRNQTNDLIIAMEAGADDFLTKPIQARELKVRIKAGQRVLSMENKLTKKNLELQHANQSLESYQQRINRDLEAAAKIQQDLLPQSAPPDYPVDLAWDLIPADELAGDIFNFYPLDEHHLGFYLVDVSGHGIPAAMLSVHLAKTLSAEPRPDSLVLLSGDFPPSNVKNGGQHKTSTSRYQSLSNSQPNNHREPKDVAARLNQHLLAGEINSLYCTMIYGVLDTRNGAGTLCQAGHPHPLICRHDGSIQYLGSGGFPIGLVPDADYDQIDFQLNSGDRLLLYSDGISECFNSEQESFGTQRLAECLTDCRSSSLQLACNKIKSQLFKWHHPAQAGSGFSDDASFLAIELQV